MPFLIPLSAIVMGITMVMFSNWLDYQKKLRMFELHHKERMAAVERGMEVPPLPPEFFINPRAASKPGLSGLRWGLIWLFGGLALAFVLLANNGPESATWALLPIALGLAQLVYHRIEAKGLDTLPTGNGARSL